MGLGFRLIAEMSRVSTTPVWGLGLVADLCYSLYLCTQRDSAAHRVTQTHTYTHRVTHTHTHTHTHTATHRVTQRDTEKDTQRQTNKETHRNTYRHKETERNRLLDTQRYTRDAHRHPGEA